MGKVYRKHAFPQIWESHHVAVDQNQLEMFL